MCSFVCPAFAGFFLMLYTTGSNNRKVGRLEKILPFASKYLQNKIMKCCRTSRDHVSRYSRRSPDLHLWFCPAEMGGGGGVMRHWQCDNTFCHITGSNMTHCCNVQVILQNFVGELLENVGNAMTSFPVLQPEGTLHNAHPIPPSSHKWPAKGREITSLPASFSCSLSLSLSLIKMELSKKKDSTFLNEKNMDCCSS